MKSQKTLILALSAFCVFGLASCHHHTTPDELEYDAPETALADGYTDLANVNAHAAKNSDGTYDYAGLKFETKDTYKTYYSTEPDELNYLTNSSQWNSEFYANMVDGLIENDQYGHPYGALARGYKVETKTDDEGNEYQEWTFQLKEGIKWVSNEYGNEYGEVTADDFVAGLEYVLDPTNGSGTAGIVYGQIAGAYEYYGMKYYDLYRGTSYNPSFEEMVGIEAVDRYTVKYTTDGVKPYFLTCLTYSPFLPVSRQYLEEQGTDFGKTFDNLLVNGAFRCTNYVKGNSIKMSKNKSYYDKDHVYVDTAVYKYLDSQIAQATTTRTWYENGTIDAFSVNSNDAEGWAKYVTGEDGTGTLANPANEICNSTQGSGTSTYVGYFNFDRTYWDYGTTSEANWSKTNAEKAATKAAVCNTNFRKGVLYGTDVTKYLEMYAGKTNYLTRIYTCKNLCSYDGKDYTEYVQDVFNEKNGTTESLYGLDAGKDIIYDATKAKEYFATAKAELIAGGLTEADFPIKLDVVVDCNAEYRAYDTAMLKTLREAGEGVITVCENAAADSDTEYYWRWYYGNYDLLFGNGWGPDYGDPYTFLHTMVVGGDMVEYVGLGQGTEENDALAEQILGHYTELVEEGNKETSDLNKRYQLFAEAEYDLIFEEAIIMPFLQANGYSASVSNAVAHQAGTAVYGLTSDKVKNVVVTTGAITKEQRSTIDTYYKANDNYGKTAE